MNTGSLSTYLSVCSGIEAASVAWKPLGFLPVGFSETDKFPSEVLQYHYPNVPNLGDMTNYKEWQIEKPDIVIGGTPCQSFSIAGQRKGLEDPRGNLTLTFIRLLDHFKPTWFVWENVQGVLSSNNGRDFHTFIEGLQEIGYSLSWRVLDAQFFGVPQRRKRLFVVGHRSADWRYSYKALFESESLSGYLEKSRKKGTARQATATTTQGSEGSTINDSYTFSAHMSETMVHKNVSGALQAKNPTAVAIQGNLIGRGDKAGPNGIGVSEDSMYTLTGTDVHGVAYDYQRMGQYGKGEKASTACARDYKDATDLVVYESHPNDSRVKPMGEVCSTVAARWGTGANNTPLVGTSRIRKLSPIECERLQGFPDNYTNIRGDKTPYGARYKALGNSMAVPVIEWIGRGIQKVEVYGHGS